MSPQGVLRSTGSVGLTLILWIICGIVALLGKTKMLLLLLVIYLFLLIPALISFLFVNFLFPMQRTIYIYIYVNTINEINSFNIKTKGSLCYVELSFLIPESGAELVYISNGFSLLKKRIGHFLGFMYCWSSSLIILPVALAIGCLSCATYLMNMIVGDCGNKFIVTKLLAILIIIFGAILTSFSAKLTNKLTVIVTSTKVIGLLVIVVGGLIKLIQGIYLYFTLIL